MAAFCGSVCISKMLIIYFRQSLPAVAAEKLSDMEDLAADYEIIGIDEGQFVSALLFIY